MIINLRPIHSIGKFFEKLSKDGQKRAKDLRKKAHRMPKIKIEQEVLALEAESRLTNFTRISGGTLR